MGHPDRFPRDRLSELATISALAGGEAATTDEVFARYEVPCSGASVEFKVPPFADKTLVPVRRAGSTRRFSAPIVADFCGLAFVELRVAADGMGRVDRAILTLDWTGMHPPLRRRNAHRGPVLIRRPLKIDLAPTARSWQMALWR